MFIILFALLSFALCLIFAKVEDGEIDSDTVVPPNGGDLTDYEWHSNKELFDAAFENNPVYCTAVRIDTIFSNDITYVVFKNKVVQFFNDNLNDLHGNVSTLYQEIAHDVFDMTSLNGVMFCTDIEAKVGMPLGEWP